MIITISVILCSCYSQRDSRSIDVQKSIQVPTLIVLGTLQDAGCPHIACIKDCCRDLFDEPDPGKKVVSLGIVDPINKQNWLFEATPDMVSQMKTLKRMSPFHSSETPDGIFLTHAHIGHYTGLMYLGKEAMNADKVPVYAMPRMKNYLETNGPWSQLVSLNNIELNRLKDDEEIRLSSAISVTPLLVPHRDEYSETVGYRILGPNKKVLFIPDIDKWERWDHDIIEEIHKVDLAFIDATFFDGAELNTRDISQIPHPFIIESMSLFEDLPESERQKIYFIHYNHTNAVLNPESRQTKTVLKNGFHLARINMMFEL